MVLENCTWLNLGVIRNVSRIIAQNIEDGGFIYICEFSQCRLRRVPLPNLNHSCACMIKTGVPPGFRGRKISTVVSILGGVVRISPVILAQNFQNYSAVRQKTPQYILCYKK